ncbi:MAG: hypothetical protein KDJ69_10210 [Nitratireductor sp.]|nr:hypothetical protein [Nitratireductor sp.]
MVGESLVVGVCLSFGAFGARAGLAAILFSRSVFNKHEVGLPDEPGSTPTLPSGKRACFQEDTPAARLSGAGLLLPHFPVAAGSTQRSTVFSGDIFNQLAATINRCFCMPAIILNV